MVAPFAQSPIVAVLKPYWLLYKLPSCTILLFMAFSTSEDDPTHVYTFDLHYFVTFYGVIFFSVASSGGWIPFSELEILQKGLRPYASGLQTEFTSVGDILI